MSKGTFEAPTVEEALKAASAEIGVPVSDLEHEVTENKEDFWGLGGGSVVIKAWQRQEAPAEPEPVAAETPVPAESEESEAVEPVETAPPAEEGPVPAEPEAAGDEAVPAATEPVPAGPEPVSAVAEPVPAVSEPVHAPRVVDDPSPRETAASAPASGDGNDQTEASASDVEPEEISRLLEQIFHDMEFECTVAVESEEGGFLATIDGADKDAILEGNGRCLSALELLANNAFRHKLPRGNKVRVDAGDFRNKRDEELSDLALQVAHSAKESGRTQETQPLNPYERRLVHLALAEDPAVTTRSRGSGFLKNVQVIPSTGGRGRSRGRR